MPRVKLTARTTYALRQAVRLRASDLNYANHMSNDAVPRLCHEGRLQLFNHFGVTELHLGQAGVGIIMGDLVANFLAEGHLHDTLLVETHPEELSRSSVRVCHRLSRDGETIALAETGLICFNYHTKKVVAWPEAVREGLAELSH